MANGAGHPRGFQKCKDCDAVGPPCDVCHGSGKVKSFSTMAHDADCQSCKGTGLEVHTLIIESCKG